MSNKVLFRFVCVHSAPSYCCYSSTQLLLLFKHTAIVVIQVGYLATHKDGITKSANFVGGSSSNGNPGITGSCECIVFSQFLASIYKYKYYLSGRILFEPPPPDARVLFFYID